MGHHPAFLNCTAVLGGSNETDKEAWRPGKWDAFDAPQFYRQC
jgi:hypothetical protein